MCNVLVSTFLQKPFSDPTLGIHCTSGDDHGIQGWKRKRTDD